MARVRGVSGHRATPLAAGWEVVGLPAGQATEPGQLQGALNWRPALVPGTAAAALRAAGDWDWTTPRSFDASDWWYRCRFPHAGGEGKPFLQLGGLATVADVWLNGQHLLHSENMFLEHAPEARGLQPESNELLIRFHALDPLLAQRRPRPRWRTRLVATQALRFMRTTLLGRIPSWSPAAAPVGPWRPVVLVGRTGLSVTSSDLQVRMDGAVGVVAAVLRVAPLAGGEGVGRAVLAVGEHEEALAVRADGGEWVLEGELRVPGAALWWPHTHGAQPLYAVKVRIAFGASEAEVELTPVGFRTVEVDRGPSGSGFALRVNGERVFCRGTCWTPMDVVTLGGEEAAYRTALDQVRAAGMNMVRVGGTMAYETDAFYDLCDRLGVLVWQDFMFANLDYPDAPEFTAEVRAEAAQVLDRLQLRPSLSVLCGNSEVEQQVAMLGLPRELWRPPLFHEVLPAACAAVRPDVPYVPSTPAGGELPFQPAAGLTHYYGVGAYLRPLEDARRAEVRFTPECLGFANVPDPVTLEEAFGTPDALVHEPRWKQRVPRDAGAGWDFDDVRDHYLAALFAVDPARLRYADAARYTALGRVVTGEVMARVFAEWRRPGSTCAGGLVWFHRDLWPGAGWGVVDAHGRPKAAYHYLRRAFAPVALLACDEGLNGLALHVLNERAAPLAAEVRVALFRGGETCVASGARAVDVPGRGHATLAAESLFPSFLDLTYAYRFGPPGHDLVVASLVESGGDRVLAEAFHFPLGLPASREDDLGLTAEIRHDGPDVRLTLRTRRFAQSVAIEVDGHSAEDNYFHLAPGSRREVRLVPSSPPRTPAGTVTALNGRAVRIVTAS